MEYVGAFAAKTHFSQLLSQVEKTGERIVVQRHGRNVAVLAPFADEEQARRKAVAERVLAGLQQVRNQTKAGSQNYKQMAREGLS